MKENGIVLKKRCLQVKVSDPLYLQDESSDDDGPGGASGNDGDGGVYLLADSERARGSGTVLAVHAGDIAVEEDQYVRGNP